MTVQRVPGPNRRRRWGALALAAVVAIALAGLYFIVDSAPLDSGSLAANPEPAARGSLADQSAAALAAAVAPIDLEADGSPAAAALVRQGGEGLPLDALAVQPGLVDQVAPPASRGPAPPRPAAPVKVRDVDPPRITAEMAVVVDERSGAILYGRDEHREVAPASLTKIVTAMVALETGNPAARVTVDVDSRVMWDSTVMGLRPGEEVSLEDLLYGLMLPSGNDAAIAIARHVARGNEGLFAELMNAKVHQLGLRHSHFVNPHGLDADRHYSSAYDMAMLARQGMRNPVFRQLAAAKEWEASGFLQSYRLVNLNRLLWQYPGADGVKIGFTDAAGRTMVVSAQRDGHRIYASFMRSNNLVADGTALLNYAFNAYAWPDP
jgi:D-alanyl-D-alanine carboxypeptidase